MDSLTRVIRPVVDAVNRQLEQSTPARELCEKLEGRRLAVRVRDTGLAVCLFVEDGRLDLGAADDPEPDAMLSGGLLALGRLAGPSGERLIADGTIDLLGEATVADDFRRLLRHARPDWEERLSGLVGDVAAHGIGDVFRNVTRWGRDARSTLEQNVGEYLQEESRTLPSRYEVDRFRDRVHELRDDVARLEARIALLERDAGDD